MPYYVVPYPVAVVIIGPPGAGKTTFIETVADPPDTRIERYRHNIGEAELSVDVPSMDYGHVRLDDYMTCVLFGAPAQSKFESMWEILARTALGFVLLIDSSLPETFPDARLIYDAFRGYSPSPIVVAANKQDIPGAVGLDDVRAALNLKPKIPIVPCVATSRESTRKVLLTLFNKYLDDEDPAR